VRFAAGACFGKGAGRHQHHCHETKVSQAQMVLPTQDVFCGLESHCLLFSGIQDSTAQRFEPLLPTYVHDCTTRRWLGQHDPGPDRWPVVVREPAGCLPDSQVFLCNRSRSLAKVAGFSRPKELAAEGCRGAPPAYGDEVRGKGRGYRNDPPCGEAPCASVPSRSGAEKC